MLEFFLITHQKEIWLFQKDTKLSQLYKALILYFDCQYHNGFLEEALLKLRYKLCLDDNIANLTVINCSEKAEVRGIEIKIFGKIINLKIKLENQDKESYYFNCEVGLLSSVKEFSEYVGITHGLMVKGFYFDKKKIYIEEDQSFASLGLIKDSEITLIFDKIKFN